MTDQVRMASHISVASCEHGYVTVRLHGPDGEIFAAASMPVQTACILIGNVEQACDAVDQSDSIGPCQGHG